jgi:formylglycine-generating enzyme required for sulfatase activity
MNRLENLGYTQEEIDCQLKWSIQQNSISQQNTTENTTAVVSSYPLNTMAHLNDMLTKTTNETNDTPPNSSSQPPAEDDFYNFECPTLNKVSTVKTNPFCFCNFIFVIRHFRV